MDTNTKARLEAIEREAHSRKAEAAPLVKDHSFFSRFVHQPSEPIFIASTEGIGSNLVRANHLDAALYYFTEQEALKAAGAPIR